MPDKARQLHTECFDLILLFIKLVQSIDQSEEAPVVPGSCLGFLRCIHLEPKPFRTWPARDQL